MLRALRFHTIVQALPAWLLMLALSVGAYAASVAWFDRSGIDEALAVIVLWQMLMASTGFMRSAAAGHYDPILVSQPRAAVALSHFAYSACAGLALWLLIVVVEWMRYPPPFRSLEVARVAAFVFVSAVSWALSLGFPRMVFGALWLLAIVIAATTRVGIEQYASLAARDSGSHAQAAHAALVALVCPFVLIGDAMPAREPAAAALMAAAAAAVLGATIYIVRRNYPLEAS